jgi:hypothetical protein
MKRFTAEPSDTLRMTAKDVEHATTGPVTAGLTGNVKLYDASNALLSTSSITANSGDDWYVDITAPATAGLYRMVMLLVVGTAQRTLEAELRVV